MLTAREIAWMDGCIYQKELDTGLHYAEIPYQREWIGDLLTPHIEKCCASSS